MLGLNAAFQAVHGFSIADTLSPVGIGNVTAADLAGLYNGDLIFPPRVTTKVSTQSLAKMKNQLVEA